MSDQIEIVIASGARTPIGAFSGGFATLPAHTLGAAAITAALSRASVGASDVSEVILGQVLTAGAGMNPARHTAMAAGVPVVVAKGTPAEKLPGKKTLRVEPHEVDEWVKAIETLIADSQLRNEIAKENIDIAKGFTWNFSANQLILSWRKLISLKDNRNCVS